MLTCLNRFLVIHIVRFASKLLCSPQSFSRRRLLQTESCHPIGPHPFSVVFAQKCTFNPTERQQGFSCFFFIISTLLTCLHHKHLNSPGNEKHFLNQNTLQLTNEFRWSHHERTTTTSTTICSFLFFVGCFFAPSHDFCLTLF